MPAGRQRAPAKAGARSQSLRSRRERNARVWNSAIEEEHRVYPAARPTERSTRELGEAELFGEILRLQALEGLRENLFDTSSLTNTPARLETGAQRTFFNSAEAAFAVLYAPANSPDLSTSSQLGASHAGGGEQTSQFSGEVPTDASSDIVSSESVRGPILSDAIRRRSVPAPDPPPTVGSGLPENNIPGSGMPAEDFADCSRQTRSPTRGLFYAQRGGRLSGRHFSF